jgi:hypothetical protein
MHKDGDRCLLADGELLPDGMVNSKSSTDVITWRYSHGTMTLCFGDRCFDCYNKECPAAGIDCDKVKKRCSDSNDSCSSSSCVASCGSDHYCRADCYSSASSCYDACYHELDYCGKKSSQDLCG